MSAGRASYPVRPVACGLVKNSGGAGVMDIKLESPNQAILEWDGCEPGFDMWFLLFFDPEGNRRVLLSSFPDEHGSFLSQVYPAPYEEDPLTLAISRGSDLRAELVNPNRVRFVSGDGASAGH